MRYHPESSVCYSTPESACVQYLRSPAWCTVLQSQRVYQYLRVPRGVQYLQSQRVYGNLQSQRVYRPPESSSRPYSVVQARVPGTCQSPARVQYLQSPACVQYLQSPACVTEYLQSPACVQLTHPEIPTAVCTSTYQSPSVLYTYHPPEPPAAMIQLTPGSRKSSGWVYEYHSRVPSAVQYLRGYLQKSRRGVKSVVLQSPVHACE
ncbi:hypothetical protein WMY93_034064 [Mugilogobius chulae]|uniref:Uncharacterized protein n=1 Tax=Mugilogobius chulae TaxID=88201 RepID=A0AAW0MFN9_9GOBI